MKLMIMGAGVNQVPIIKKAKKRFSVVVCDNHEDAPGKGFADEYYCLKEQTSDIIAELAIKCGASGIITNTEAMLQMVEKANEIAGFPNSQSNSINLLTNKSELRKHINCNKEYFVPYYESTNIDEAIAFYTKLSRKSIMKPVDNSASRGVYSINSIDDIKENFTITQQNSRDKKSVLLEEYIDGTEFTADGIVDSNGRHHTLAISKKKHYDYNENVAYELYFSYFDSQFDYDRLRKINNEIAESTGLKLGITHSEYKFDGNNFKLIEMSARGGGNFIATHIVPYVSGLDNYEMLFDMAVGKKRTYNGISKEYRDRSAILKFFDSPSKNPCVVKEIIGEDIFFAYKEIIKYERFFDVGDVIVPASDDSRRIGYYIACCDSSSKLLQINNEIENRFIIKI